jgi:hypothetical protein
LNRDYARHGGDDAVSYLVFSIGHALRDELSRTHIAFWKTGN